MLGLVLVLSMFVLSCTDSKTGLSFLEFNQLKIKNETGVTLKYVYPVNTATLVPPGINTYVNVIKDLAERTLSPVDIPSGQTKTIRVPTSTKGSYTIFATSAITWSGNVYVKVEPLIDTNGKTITITESNKIDIPEYP